MDITLILLALTVTYLTHILLLERKESHFGPFQDKDRIVLFKGNAEEDAHVQSVVLFDWIRRLFGVYKVEQHVWTVQEIPSQRWTCPICLSFWIAAFVLLMKFFVPHPLFDEMLILFSLAAVSSIVNVNWL